MKKVLFTCLVMTMIIGGCAQEKKSPIDGIWKLRYGKWNDWNHNDTITYQFPGNMAIYHIKIFSKENFTYVGHYNLDSLTHDNYGGGTYTLNGDRYEENLLFAGKSIINKKIRLILEVQNDTLIQKWPANENWELDEKYSVEKYVRLK